jgi:Fe-S cluster biogenesis protein NfuA
MEKREIEQELSKKVEDILTKVKPSLGGADVQLREIRRGIVTLEYYRPLSNPSACHVDRTLISKEMVKEVLEDQLKKMIPDFKEVILLEN